VVALGLVGVLVATEVVTFGVEAGPPGWMEDPGAPGLVGRGDTLTMGIVTVPELETG